MNALVTGRTCLAVPRRRDPRGLAASPGGWLALRACLALTAALTLTALAAAPALAATGDLVQKPGASGCVSSFDTGGDCAAGTGLTGAQSVAVSPDGKNAYVVGAGSGALTIFDRDATSGVLTQKATTAGCISQTGDGLTCTDAVGIDSPREVAVSPDGRNVYVAAFGSADGGVAVFDRDASTGALTQKAGTAACVSDTGAGGACADGVALGGAVSLTVSPEGNSVYVASGRAPDGDALAILDRDPATGALTQKAGTAGCFSMTGTGGGCQVEALLNIGARGPNQVAISPDGGIVYVAAEEGGGAGAIVIYGRDTGSGELYFGLCISTDGTGGQCSDGVAVDGATGIAVSPDGNHAYVATRGGALAVFGDQGTNQLSGTAGCISGDGTGGACATGVGFGAAATVTLSPDGRSVYLAAPGATATSGSLAILDRNRTTGVLTQKPGTAGCVSNTGDGGVCVDGRQLAGATGVTVSPDLKNVYLASPGVVAVFDRETGDVTVPETTITNGPADGAVIADRTPTYEFTSNEAGSTFQCRFEFGGFGNWESCASPHTTEQIDGEQVFQVRAIDVAGNTDPTPASRTITVDADPPQTTITAGPPSIPTSDTTATFEFTATEAGSTFECRVDAAAFASCSSPHTTAAVGDGAHTFAVRGIDVLGNVDQSPATRAFTVDATAPNTTIGSGPTGTTGDSTPSFGFSSSEDELGSRFECRVDTAAFATCTPPHTTGGLGDGAHTFEVRAIDAQGNVDASPASRSFSVDTAVPQTSVGAGPAGATGDRKPTFAFASSEAGSSFACRVDTDAFVSCSSPHTTAALGDGAHTFEVRATDPVGNVDASPASRSFSVDTAAPQTSIEAGPVGMTDDATPTFAFASSEAGSSFACRVDDGEFASCGSPHTTAALGNGAHSFAVRATDAVGNVDQSAASRSFAVAPAVAAVAAAPAGAGKTINGTPGKDRLVGTAGDDVINCGAGDDVVIAGGGDDTINCGAGKDTVSGGAGNDTINGGAGNDKLSGNAGNDRISGNAGDDRLLGGSGRDRLFGGAGKDVLLGGAGLDVLNGGPGKDKETQ